MRAGTDRAGVVGRERQLGFERGVPSHSTWVGQDHDFLDAMLPEQSWGDEEVKGSRERGIEDERFLPEALSFVRNKGKAENARVGEGRARAG